MLWLGIGLALAGEPVTEESTYNRLFQEGRSASGENAPIDEPGVPLGSWIIPTLMLLGAGGFLLWQRQKLGTLPQSTLRVLHRQPIGDRTSVVLLEVPDRDGDTRRLLIGTGPGAPVLLADLGFSEAPREASVREATARESTPRPEPLRPVAAVEARPVVPKAAPKAPTRAEPARTEPARAPTRSASGGNIAQEILAERVRVRPQDNFREEGDYDDPDDASDIPPSDDDDTPPSPPSPPNRGFSRLLARIGD